MEREEGGATAARIAAVSAEGRRVGLVVEGTEGVRRGKRRRLQREAGVIVDVESRQDQTKLRAWRSSILGVRRRGSGRFRSSRERNGTGLLRQLLRMGGQERTGRVHERIRALERKNCSRQNASSCLSGDCRSTSYPPRTPSMSQDVGAWRYPPA